MLSQNSRAGAESFESQERFGWDKVALGLDGSNDMMTIIGRPQRRLWGASRYGWRGGIWMLAAALTFWAAAAVAQTVTGENGGDPADPVDDIQGLIDDIQTRVDSIARASTGADTALDLLNEQVEEAIAKLTSRLDENVALRGQTVGLASELQSLSNEESNLQDELARITQDRDGTIVELEQQIALLADELAAGTTTRASLDDRISFLADELETNEAERTRLSDALAATQEERAKALATIEEQGGTLRDLSQEVATLQSLRDTLAEQVARLSGTVETGRGALSQENERADRLRAALGRSETALAATQKRALDNAEQLRLSREELLDERSRALTLSERLTLALGELSTTKSKAGDITEQLAAAKKQGLAALGEKQRALEASIKEAKTTAASLKREKSARAEARDRVSLLTDQLTQLKQQLQALNSFLEISETKNSEQRAQIVDLGSRLNQALATKVQELASYRSEFFGRLREALGARSDVREVGDRFVFQSEVLFASGEATLGHDGEEQLLRLATTLAEISKTIPADVDWVLRVDGHTDERPISTPEFPSNWELSTARALSVVKFLIASGIPPNRLVAAGFGQFQPLDPRRDEIGFRRNRRIEFKLTQR